MLLASSSVLEIDSPVLLLFSALSLSCPYFHISSTFLTNIAFKMLQNWYILEAGKDYCGTPFFLKMLTFENLKGREAFKIDNQNFIS